MNRLRKLPSTDTIGRLSNALFGFAIVARVAWAPGWPHSHEYNSFFMRTEIFATHFRRGDLFPIWSTSDSAGMGSPLPFYYHRFFYCISGTFRALGLNVKVAVALTLFLLFLLGYELTRRMLKLLNPSPAVCAVLAMTYVYSTYLMSNLVIRGAFAEISFTMLVPGLVYCWIKIVRDGKWPWYTVIIALLCYSAHNAMALATVFVLGVSGLPGLLANGASHFRRAVVPMVASIGAAGIVMAPYLYLYSRFGKDFNPAAVITQNGWIPTANFPKLVEFILVPIWFRMPDKVNVGLLSFVPILLVSTAIYLDRQRHRKYLGPFGKSVAIFVVLPFLLQTPVSTIVYNVVTPLNIVQFSWRFSGVLALALVTLVAAAFAARTADKANWLSSQTGVALTVTAALTIVTAPLLVTTDPGYTPNIIGDIPSTPIVFELRYNGEYLPAIHGSPDTAVLRNQTADANVAFDYTAQGSCALQVNPWEFEATSRTFTGSCAEPAEVVLPLYYSNLHTVSVDGDEVEATRTDLDGRIHLDLPRGDSEIEVVFPRVP